MKVFELMNELSALPAGADVEVRGIMGLKEFTELDQADSCLGDGKIIASKIDSVEEVDENSVYIYLE